MHVESQSPICTLHHVQSIRYPAPPDAGTTSPADDGLVEGVWHVFEQDACIRPAYITDVGTITETQESNMDAPTGTYDWLNPIDSGSVGVVTYDRVTGTFSTNWYIGGNQWAISSCVRRGNHEQQCRLLDGNLLENKDVLISLE